jgi:hypothetical protein
MEENKVIISEEILLKGYEENKKRKESLKKYRQTHKEIITGCLKRYKETHKEIINACAKRHYEKIKQNPDLLEKRRQQKREYYQRKKLEKLEKIKK